MSSWSLYCAELIEDLSVCLAGLHETHLEEALDPLPGRHHDGRHHPGEPPGHGQLGWAENLLTAALLHLLAQRVGVEADGENGRRPDQRGSHTCNDQELAEDEQPPSTEEPWNEKNLNVLFEMRQ